MGEEIAFEYGWFSDFQGLVTLTWIGSYCIPSCITRRPLPTYQISLKSNKLFVDGRTYGHTDGHLRRTLLGWLGGVDLKKNAYRQHHLQQTGFCNTRRRFNDRISNNRVSNVSIIHSHLFRELCIVKSLFLNFTVFLNPFQSLQMSLEIISIFT